MTWATFIFLVYTCCGYNCINVSEVKTDAQVYTTTTSVTYVFE